jgi:acyl-CoA synthetase (AMP-forming)/AMP-acid ligase II
MNVAQLLSDRALDMPDHAAIIDRSASRPRTLSFAQLDVAAARAAAAFASAGLRPNDRVVVVHPMSADLYVGLAGLLRAGCVPTVCDPAARRADIDRACAQIAPRALFGSLAGLAWALSIPQLARIGRRFACVTLPGVVDIRATHVRAPLVERASTDAAVVSFTSGSTGTPKIVVRSHGLLGEVLAATREVGPVSGVDVATMPIVLLANLAAGVTSVIPGIDLRRPGRADAQRLADDIAATRATSIVASPALLERLTRIDVGDRLGSLTTIVSGGGAVLPALIDALRRRLPQADVIAVYGSTEAEPIAHVRAAEIDAADRRAMRAGGGVLAGRPARAARIRIIAAGRGTEPAVIDALAPNAVGEIIVAGPHVVRGYLAGRGDAETKLHDGATVWHRTGDLGYVDERGRVWLRGRVSAAVRDARGELDPFAVECALSFEPTIARSALCRVGDRRVVAVEPLRGATIDPARIRAALAWTAIDDVRVTRIPVDRRHNAKVDYRALARRIGARA